MCTITIPTLLRTFEYLNGLSHEIDFKNLQNYAAAGF
jgi:hypothetical protein